MSIQFPEHALPPADSPSNRPADNVFVLLLDQHPALSRYGFEVTVVGSPIARRSPWVQSAVTRYAEEPWKGVTAPISGVDVYSSTPFEAQDAAQRIASIWPYLKRLSIPSEDTHVLSAWTDVGPYLVREADADDEALAVTRYHMELGLVLAPLTSEESVLD